MFKHIFFLTYITKDRGGNEDKVHNIFFFTPFNIEEAIKIKFTKVNMAVATVLSQKQKLKICFKKETKSLLSQKNT